MRNSNARRDIRNAHNLIGKNKYVKINKKKLKDRQQFMYIFEPNTRPKKYENDVNNHSKTYKTFNNIIKYSLSLPSLEMVARSPACRYVVFKHFCLLKQLILIILNIV